MFLSQRQKLVEHTPLSDGIPSQLSAEFMGVEPGAWSLEPAAVLGVRNVDGDSTKELEVLIQWAGLQIHEAKI